MKTLIAYGTRYGATAGTTDEISRVLQEEGHDVSVFDVKKSKIKDLNDYELIIIGSGMKMARWVGEAEDFIKKFQRDLRLKQTAMFVSSGAQALHKFDGATDQMKIAWTKYLVEKAEKYSIQPIMMAIFGGVWDYNKMGFPFKKALIPFQEKLREAGFQESEPGVFDTRDWDEIRSWARCLSEKASELHR
jgi:menaquinone-dependent protoporphyrinogen oxidase